jgi:hypothetical protein
VGLKPTIGVVSRAGVVPISHTQDTVGPHGRTVADAVIALNAIASRTPDAGDAATRGVPLGWQACNPCATGRRCRKPGQPFPGLRGILDPRPQPERRALGSRGRASSLPRRRSSRRSMPPSKPSRTPAPRSSTWMIP